MDLPGNDYTNSELYVFTNKPSYETQWHAYETNPPSNPGWTTTLPVVTVNPKSVQRGPCFVKLRANRPVQFSTNPIGVTVVGGRRTKVRVVYP